MALLILSRWRGWLAFAAAGSALVLACEGHRGLASAIATFAGLRSIRRAVRVFAGSAVRRIGVRG